MRTTILWIHALGGGAWVGAAIAFVIGASASGGDDEAGFAMIRRVAPAINRIGLGAMLFIVITGVVNIYLAGMTRRFQFSNAFVVLLSMKIALLGGMYFMLIQSWRAQHELMASDRERAQRAARRLIAYSIVIAGCGGLALLLGLWLLGA